jgi:hypothetical protein
MPGCTGYATTLDHITPWSVGGRDTVENLRPACKHCNSLRNNRIISGYGATIHIVTGPPAAGKTTYVAEHAGSNDLVLDFDAIARTLMPASTITHDHPLFLRRITAAAWNGARREMERTAEPVTVWIIKTMPTDARHPSLLTEWIALHYRIHVVDPGINVVADRIARGERPATALDRAKEWYRLGVSERLASIESSRSSPSSSSSSRPRL